MRYQVIAKERERYCNAAMCMVAPTSIAAACGGKRRMRATAAESEAQYAGYAKQTLERALPATRKRYAHRLANIERTKFQNIGRNSFQNDPEGNNSGTG